MLQLLKNNYIFAVVRGKTQEDAINIARAAIKGGINNIEITYTTPNASDVIKTLALEFSTNENVVIGAGTVMDTNTAKEAIANGAKFLVSPHFSADIQKVAVQEDSLYFPGCATVTEIVNALNTGVKIIKIFPGGALGPGFIKDVHGPLPNVDLMPSGGVSLDNIKKWKEAGACAVGVGGALTATVKEKGYDGVTEIAKKFIAALNDRGKEQSYER